MDRIPSQPGVYVVSLTNEHPISANADRPQIASRCITVTKANCKYGRARSLARRRLDYCKTFGPQYVIFRPVAVVENPEIIEAAVGFHLLRYRIAGQTGRLNEWLQGIGTKEVERIVIEALVDSGVPHRLLGEQASPSAPARVNPAPTRPQAEPNEPLGVTPSRLLEAAHYLESVGMSLDQLRMLHHSLGRSETFKATYGYFSKKTDLQMNNVLYGARLIFVEERHRAGAGGLVTLVQEALGLYPHQR